MAELARVPEHEDAVEEQSVWPLAVGAGMTVFVVVLTLSRAWGALMGLVFLGTMAGWTWTNVRAHMKRPEERSGRERDVGLGRSRLWWGSFWLVVSEVALFGAAFVVLAVHDVIHDPDAPEAFKKLGEWKSFVASIVLWSSGFTGMLAHRRIEGGRSRAATRWLVATVALGAAFLLFQGYEYWNKAVNEGFTLDSSRHANLFYLLTGLHGTHLVGGLIVLAVLVPLASRGHLDPPKAAPLGAAMLYWHFVDAAWVFIYGILYLKLI